MHWDSSHLLAHSPGACSSQVFQLSLPRGWQDLSTKLKELWGGPSLNEALLEWLSLVAPPAAPPLLLLLP